MHNQCLNIDVQVETCIPMSLLEEREVNDCRHYFKINLCGTWATPWIPRQTSICTRTRYRLRYAARRYLSYLYSLYVNKLSFCVVIRDLRIGQVHFIALLSKRSLNLIFKRRSERVWQQLLKIEKWPITSLQESPWTWCYNSTTFICVVKRDLCTRFCMVIRDLFFELGAIVTPLLLTSTKLGLMFLLKDTTQWRRWGTNSRPFVLESSTLPLRHCLPQITFLIHYLLL